MDADYLCTGYFVDASLWLLLNSNATIRTFVNPWGHYAAAIAMDRVAAKRLVDSIAAVRGGGDGLVVSHVIGRDRVSLFVVDVVGVDCARGCGACVCIHFSYLFVTASLGEATNIVYRHTCVVFVVEHVALPSGSGCFLVGIGLCGGVSFCAPTMGFDALVFPI